jgi:hypothetical protein
MPAPAARRSRAALATALVSVLLIISLAGALYWWRDPTRGLSNTVQPPPQGESKEKPAPPKIPDRMAQTSQPDQVAPAAVAQRALLYEEDPKGSQGKRFVGSAIWRTETVSPGAGQPPEIAIRADVEIPERNLKVTLSIRRNIDKSLPASHTIELMFNIPANFPFGGISNLPGILMKPTEQGRGEQLGGLTVKVTPTFFLVGLRSDDAQHNIQLLKERAWFDIPIVYTDGHRAILAVEKGTPGERAFVEAFKAWGQ